MIFFISTCETVYENGKTKIILVLNVSNVS